MRPTATTGSWGAADRADSTCRPAACARSGPGLLARRGINPARDVGVAGGHPLGGIAEKVEEAERVGALARGRVRLREDALLAFHDIASIRCGVRGSLPTAIAAAVSHSGSVGSRYFLPVFTESRAAKASAAGRAMLIAGYPA